MSPDTINGAEPETRRLRRYGPAAGLFLLTVVLQWSFTRASVAVPYVFGDEAGYLLKAAALAGYRTDAYSSYYPGYPLLLAPLFAWASDPFEAFRLAQGFNALLTGIAAVLAFALARRLAPQTGTGRAWLAALVVTAYPASLAYAAFALSENLFVPLVLLIGWLLLRQLARPSWRQALGISLACAGLLLTHPKAAMVVAALYLAWFIAARGWQPIVSAVLALTLSLPSWLILDSYFKHRLGYYADGVNGHYPDAQALHQQVLAALAPAELAKLAENLVGQSLYLIIAGAGLIPIGAMVLLRRLPPLWRERNGLPSPDTGVAAYALFALLSLGMTMLLTAFFMRGMDRVDHLFYGRYNEGVVALLMLPALLWPPSRRVWYGTIVLLLLMALLLAGIHGTTLRGEVVQINMIGWEAYRALSASAIQADGIRTGFIAVAAAALLLVLARMTRHPALPWLVLAVFLVGAWQASHGYLRPESDYHARQHLIADALKARGARCVDYDVNAGDYWLRYQYQFALLPARLHEVRLAPPSGITSDEAAPSRCSEWMISSSPHVGDIYPKAQPLLREALSTQTLWRIPTSVSNGGMDESQHRGVGRN